MYPISITLIVLDKIVQYKLKGIISEFINESIEYKTNNTGSKLLQMYTLNYLVCIYYKI
jgi:hypothetical protein